jgi:hypothetical protein
MGFYMASKISYRVKNVTKRHFVQAYCRGSELFIDNIGSRTA